MGFFKNLLTNITTTKRVSTVQMVQERGNGFYSYNGKMYQSDIVRACIRPKIKAIGKLTAKHIRETVTASARKLAVNPEPYIRFLLEEPNQYMTGQLLQEMTISSTCAGTFTRMISSATPLLRPLCH